MAVSTNSKKTKNESVRLFENDFMEALTHVHPITPLVMWAPVAIWCIYRAIMVKELGALEFSLWAVFAILVWTLTEYSLHRWVFHFDAKSRVGKYFVFLFHGIHHDYPDDATRLVMPPAPAIIIMSMLYGIISLLVPAQNIEVFMAFFIIGYLCYDYIHYATHHFPMTSKVGRYLRKFHLQHHFANEHSKYGVSNPLWDYVFNTVTGPKKSDK